MDSEFSDIYHLDRHKDEIIATKGYGKKSYENMIKAIEKVERHHLFHLSMLSVFQISAKDRRSCLPKSTIMTLTNS